jgi:mannosylglycerate hydrolase
VPHTHWDREWYLPFQSFRLRLVRLIDKVLDMLEADERFVFTLDGQLQTVDDYVELRPDAVERMRPLVEEGRLAVGPWQVLMDEFLVSGETIWRNLERGLARGDELGGAMRIGYLPDMFGHIAQMPQILRAFGLDTAVVWRGVPRAVEWHAFEWRGIDGSSVRAEYLPAGYGNAAGALDVPERFRDAIEELVAALEPFFDDDPLLAMYGTDHTEPLPGLVDHVERANANGRVQIHLRTLGQVLGPGTGTRLAWTGEMRSGARANLLPNVTSARIDLKQAAARAERWLERYAEPFAALHGNAWPAEFLELAWRRVIENSAHDSICGCSADAVSAQVLVRYAEAEQIARDLANEALAGARGSTPRDAYVVANPTPAARDDAVELELAVPEEWESVALELPGGERVATQEVSRNVPDLHRAQLPGSEISELLRRRLHGRELFGQWLNGFRIEDGPRLTLELDRERDPVWLDVGELRAQIELAAAARADEQWEVVFRTRPRRQVVARVPAKALGWTSVRAVEGDSAVDAPVERDGNRLDNGFVQVDATDIEGTVRIVRGFDVGDSYNYAPPEVDHVVDRPDDVHVEVREDGPLRAVLAVTRTYNWAPDHVVPTETLVELRAGEPFVRLRLAFDNPADDQRVRVHVPLLREADRTYAEGQYAVVERGTTVEGGYGEEPLPTFPASSFVAAGGVALLLEHVTEYELVDGRELALTVLRSTGLISRNTNRYREDPAGPEIEIPDAQLHGRRTIAFAIYPFEGDRPGIDVLEQTERFGLPFLALPGTAEGDELGDAEGLELSGEGVVLAALRRREGALEARIVNETDTARPATLGATTVELRPWEIRTAPTGG